MTTQEQRAMAWGLAVGTVLGLLLGAAFVAFTNDWSWLAFTVTLGWALGLGIGLNALRDRSQPRQPRK